MVQNIEHRERRLGSRKPIVLNVELYHENQHLGYFKTRNINYRGMFVKTGPVRLSINDRVEIRVRLGGIRLEKQRLKGIVEHCCDEGVGVMFTEYRSVPFHALRVLLFNSDSPIGLDTENQPHEFRRCY